MWGVPITVFIHKETSEVLKDEAVNKRIFDAFVAEGADAWFADGAKERFLGNDYKADEWDMVRDILDVWFDSGSTHAFVLEQREDLAPIKGLQTRRLISGGVCAGLFALLVRVALTTPWAVPGPAAVGEDATVRIGEHL